MTDRSASNVVKDLMTYEDIAEDLGVKVTSVYQYALRDDEFPKPAIATRSPVFLRKDIERWKLVREARGKNRPGRPRRSDRKD